MLASAMLSQVRPWTPPATTLPAPLVETARFLLAHGMGDPRGGAYREATVRGIDLLNDGKPSTVHGWVLAKGTRIVTPDGLVYEPLSVGAAASLEADVAFPTSPSVGKGFNPYVPHHRWTHVGSSLLLLMNRADLATKVEARYQALETNVFRGSAASILSSWFDRTLTAFVKGEDKTASTLGHVLMLRREQYAAEVVRHNPGGLPPFNFLRPLPRIVAQVEDSMRMSHPAWSMDRLRAMPQPQRIGVLVGTLGEAMSPAQKAEADVLWTEDGDAAVASLLDVIERDTRLTRKVGSFRPWLESRTFVEVRRTALDLVGTIAGYSVANPETIAPDGTIRIGPLRAYWEKYRSLPPAERAAAALADDDADPAQWAGAMRKLLKVYKNAPTPGLSRLVARRARGLVEGGEIATGLEMAVALSELDPASAREALAGSTEAAFAAIRKDPSSLRGSADALGNAVGRHIALDEAAFPAYLAWLASLPVHKLQGEEVRLFRPLMTRDDDPRVAALFLAEGSPFNLAEIVKVDGFYGVERFAASPLLALAPVRESLKRILASRETTGEVWRDGKDSYRREEKDGSGGRFTVASADDPQAPPLGEHRAYRRCDAMGAILSDLEGAPPLRLYWPAAERDAAIERLSAFLDAKGESVGKAHLSDWSAE